MEDKFSTVHYFSENINCICNVNMHYACEIDLTNLKNNNVNLAHAQWFNTAYQNETFHDYI